MEKLPRRNGAFVLSIAVVLLVGVTSAVASGSSPATASKHKHKRRHRYLPVRCQDPDYFAVIDKTGKQLIAQYNAMGFAIGSPADIAEGGGHSIDGETPGEACRYAGTKHLKGGISTGVREGNGFMIDYLSPGQPPFPGETNPAIREYDWKWKELVSNTRKGVLHGTISMINCTKYSYEGSFSQPGDAQAYPC
jgi:hypothetical protein